MQDIRLERTKILNQSLPKKIHNNLIKKTNKREVLEELINISKFDIDAQAKDWIISHCKNQKQVIYSFKLFRQLGLNNGRTHSAQEDMTIINKYINFSILDHSNNDNIGRVYTLGVIKGIVEEVEIRCFTTPAKVNCGKLTCNEDISINYPHLNQIIKNYSTYIKFYPQKPENIGEWELALEIAIYSSIYNKILPWKSIILGGVTGHGRIRPIRKDIIKSINKDQHIIISNKNEIPLSRINANLIHVDHIDEVISLLEPLKDNQKKHLEDFLCDMY